MKITMRQCVKLYGDSAVRMYAKINGITGGAALALWDARNDDLSDAMIIGLCEYQKRTSARPPAHRGWNRGVFSPKHEPRFIPRKVVNTA